MPKVSVRGDTVALSGATSPWRCACLPLLQRERFEMALKDFGWNSYWEAQWNDQEREGCAPARVTAQHRGGGGVVGQLGERNAEVSGKLRLAAEGGADWPAVGDWVAVRLRNETAHALIEGVLPRRTRFARKMAGTVAAAQVLAANIDIALIVAALDGDFNVRRIERYVAQCWES